MNNTTSQPMSRALAPQAKGMIEAGYSLEAISEMLGVTLASITLLANGQIYPDVVPHPDRDAIGRIKALGDLDC